MKKKKIPRLPLEASVINSSSDDIANQIRNLFNVNL